MKPLRQFCAMFLMAFVLALPIKAGEMNAPPEAPPGDGHTPGRISNDMEMSLTTTLVLAVLNIKKTLGQ